ncbi:protein kinase superfamily protein [Tasmannia lanceolata]|uniref:protein kinase superfamily protein n=1 Tax=Tasmannia lanceolata TaxID=3420 RepID=UPI004063AEFE
MANLATLPLSIVSSLAPSSTKENKRRVGNLAQVLRQDREFLKLGFQKFKSVHLPTLSKSFENFFWMRNLEDPHADPTPTPPWPNPSYPGLSGTDLLIADLNALKDYAYYFYHVSQVWSTPLPDVYDPQRVADYFNCRPHILAFRVLEVFSSFTTAVIKMRTSEMFNRSGVDGNGDRKSAEYYIGQLLKQTMLNLGPTFIKVGQSVSTRPDIIGSEISKALSELHDQIPPFPRAMAMEIIEAELGCPVETVFSYISEEPVAAASFGQVYRASTFDGCSVAVKVQRPDLHHMVVRDIYILRLGLRLLQKVAKRKSDLCLYADELGKGFTGELDYTLEAVNASEFLEAHKYFPFIFVPRVFRHLTRRRVLTMEWVIGENPNELLSLSRDSGHHSLGYSERQRLEAKTHLLDLVNKGVEATLVQLLETGLLHADPHPGNLLYTSSGQIGFLDFGLLCRMKRKHQFAMLASILHIVNGDWAGLVYDLTEMDVVMRGTNIRRVTMELEEALGEVVFKDGIPDIKFSRVLGKIWMVALKYNFRMPPYYTLVLRSLASLEGLAVATDQDFKTFQAAYPYVVRKLLTDNSADTKRILHSVVFNKKKEFQWQKLALFLKIGATRKCMHGLNALDPDTRPEYTTNEPNGVFEVSRLILRILPSKNGTVLRRLLMTVDPASLIRSMTSKEAIFFRQYFTRSLADVLHQWMTKTHGRFITRLHGSHMTTINVQHSRETGLPSESSSLLLRDRRMKVIFYRVLNGVRRDPILMMRFCWTSFVISISALALACHRFLVSCSEIYITSVKVSPKRVAVSV